MNLIGDLLLSNVSHSFGALALLASSKLAVLAWSGHAPVLGALATTSYWQGEVAGAVWVASTLPMLFYVLAHPALLRRRIPRAEQAPRQKIIKALFGLGGMVMYGGSFLSWGFDYNWSSIPVPVALLGDLLIAGGSLLIWQVFRINAYASSIVTVELEQPVISTGLYALVRHPLYSASLLLLIGVPVALGARLDRYNEQWPETLFIPRTGATVRRFSRDRPDWSATWVLGPPEKFTSARGLCIFSAAIVCQRRPPNKHLLGSVKVIVAAHAAENSIYQRCLISLTLRYAARSQALS